MTATLETLPVILEAESMTAGMARYWNALAAKMRGRVDIVDPWRKRLPDLRRNHPELKGKRIYRASTGGTHGKSSEIKVI